MRKLTTTASLLLTAALASCAVPGPDSSPDSGAPEPIASDASPIISGTADTTHPAVVAVLSNSSACTGTIIKVSGSVGYVLTAAHCCETPSPEPPVVVVQGNDYNVSGNIQYSVLSYKAHAGYDYAGQGAGSPYDFCMIKIGGTNASTPVIPALTPAQDTLGVGKQVALVGYGLTDGMQSNSVRRKTTATIDQINSTQFGFPFSPGGICSGDSGGPALYTIAGTEYVAGVASFSDENCVSYGGEGRVSAVYDSFIQKFINDQPITLSCDECFKSSTAGSGSCAGKVDTCLNNTECNALAECLSGCTTSACDKGCTDAHPAGLPKYFAIYSCACDSPCKTSCSGEPVCEGLPGACFYDWEAPTCDTCMKGSCCSQAAACANDSTCAKCLNGTTTSGCTANAAYNAFASCQTTSCDAQCGGSSGAGGSSSSSSSTTSTGVGGAGSTTSGAGGSGSTTVGVGGGAQGGAGGGSTGTVGQWTPGGFDDEEPATDPDQGGGCSTGSSGAPAGSAGWVGAALALVIAARRRRQAA